MPEQNLNPQPQPQPTSLLQLPRTAPQSLRMSEVEYNNRPPFCLVTQVENAISAYRCEVNGEPYIERIERSLGVHFAGKEVHKTPAVRFPINKVYLIWIQPSIHATPPPTQRKLKLMLTHLEEWLKYRHPKTSPTGNDLLMRLDDFMDGRSSGRLTSPMGPPPRPSTTGHVDAYTPPLPSGHSSL